VVADETKDMTPEEAKPRLEKERIIVSLYIDNAKTYIQLSTGALVLSVALIRGLSGSDSLPMEPLFVVTWVCWLISILAGVTYQYSAVKYLEILEHHYGFLYFKRDWKTYVPESLPNNPYRIYGVMMGSFYLGTILFTIAAIIEMAQK
jgi:hypothetical protein